MGTCIISHLSHHQLTSPHNTWIGGSYHQYLQLPVLLLQWRFLYTIVEICFPTPEAVVIVLSRTFQLDQYIYPEINFYTFQDWPSCGSSKKNIDRCVYTYSSRFSKRSALSSLRAMTAVGWALDRWNINVSSGLFSEEYQIQRMQYLAHISSTLWRARKALAITLYAWYATLTRQAFGATTRTTHDCCRRE